jgi:hypothetical protein
MGAESNQLSGEGEYLLTVLGLSHRSIFLLIALQCSAYDRFFKNNFSLCVSVWHIRYIFNFYFLTKMMTQLMKGA